MFFKYFVFVILVTEFIQFASLANSCNLTALPPDPASGCCGIDNSGGKNRPLRKFPWLALVEFRNVYEGSYEPVCTGALISGQFVLTAAQCVTGIDGGKPSSVRLGEYDQSNDFGSKDCVNQESVEECTPGAIRIPVESSTAHSMYGSMLQNDIALLKLAEIVPYTDYIRPICLPSEDITINPPHNLNLVVAGWGLINRNDDSSNHVNINTRRHINLPFWTSARCRVRWPSLDGANQVCAGGDGISGSCVCMGDTGAPVMYENGGVYQAIGIVSFGGARCAMKDAPDVSTKVFAYKSWIDQVIAQKQNTSQCCNPNPNQNTSQSNP